MNRKKIDLIIIMGLDFIALYWLFFNKLFIKTKIFVRLGGDPISGRTSRIKNNILSNKDRIMLKIKHKISIKLIKNINNYVLVNDFLMSQLKEYNEFSKKQFFIIPQYKNIDHYVEKDYFKNGEMKLLTVANLDYKEKYNGVKKIILLISKINSGLKIKFDIVGGGAYLNELKEFLNSLKITNKSEIKIHGFLDEVKNFYKSRDIFIYYSELDALPNVVLEAMSFQLPIFINKYDPFIQIIHHKENGFFYDENNMKKFQNDLFCLYRNKILCKKIGQNNYNVVRENYSQSEVKNKIYNLIYGL